MEIEEKFIISLKDRNYGRNEILSLLSAKKRKSEKITFLDSIISIYFSFSKVSPLHFREE